jgi:hypothetical protein
VSIVGGCYDSACFVGRDKASIGAAHRPRVPCTQSVSRKRDAVGCLGGYRDGKYEEQSQRAQHDNFLNIAAIKFVRHLPLPIIMHMTIRMRIMCWLSCVPM